MKKKNIVILILVSISLIELLLIKPFSLSFYNFKIFGKLITVIGMYGFPIYILLPLALFLFLIFLPRIKKHDFWARVANATRNLYLAFSVIVLIVISLLVFSKFVLNNDLFPHVLYSSLKGTEEDISDING